MLIWAVSDGRRGIETQALGLAEAVGRLTGAEVGTRRVSSHDVFEALPPVLQTALKPTPAKFGLIGPLPDLAVGCGRQAVAPLVALRKAGVRTVFVQDPRTSTELFDLVVAPEHDGLHGANVITMLGSPNRVTPDRLEAARAEFADDLAALPAPRAAILIGGDSKRHTLSGDAATVHLRAARELLDAGYSLLVTLSRRTPDHVVPHWSKLGANLRGPRVWLHDGRSATRNPYMAFLAGADLILVTEDSTNMLTEAASTGARVFRLPMAGKPGKFSGLYAALHTRCGVEIWDGVPSKARARLKPLHETQRVAGDVVRKLDLAT